MCKISLFSWIRIYWVNDLWSVSLHWDENLWKKSAGWTRDGLVHCLSQLEPVVEPVKRSIISHKLKTSVNASICPEAGIHLQSSNTERESLLGPNLPEDREDGEDAPRCNGGQRTDIEDIITPNNRPGTC